MLNTILISIIALAAAVWLLIVLSKGAVKFTKWMMGG